ncbi:glycosyltransferase family 4 protein [Bdellovibrio bacteriovorus]|uniref:glycosyltransferase family 4 protein n=1 Tax=Bdellovibrio bacteriovorus TaxID=959 RepID=UPI0035A64252
MNILVVTQYFFPETFIINDLVVEMKKQGHKVTVLTGKPNYPEGNLFPGFKSGGIQHDLYDGDVEVVRVPLRPRGKGGAKNLALNYLSFVFAASFSGPWLLRKKKCDVVFVFGTSPITVAFPAILLKWIKRVPMALWVQDLWPQSLVVTKFVRNKFLLKLVEMMVWFIYKCTDLLLVQSKTFIEPVREIVPDARPLYYPNSFKRMEVSSEVSLSGSVMRTLEDSFSVVFAGNIGKAQSVETIVEAAKLLKNVPDIKIVFVGSGSMLSWIQEQKILHGLDNVDCLGRFDISYIPLIYSKADALLLTLNSDDILQYTLPWKTQSYMAAGKPIIGAIDGEGARVIAESNCGLAGPAENAVVLADNIRRLHAMSEEQRGVLGKNGMDYYEKNFEMGTQVKRLVQLFDEVRR